MLAYHGKLLELLSIDKVDNSPFLRIRLSFDQDIELLWEIDQDTADNLKAVTTLEQSHKYRLSFYSSWDSSNNQYVSFLTKTYRNQSEKIYFPCTEAYVNGLNAIKSSNRISQIQELPFVSTHPQPIDFVKQETANPTRFYRKLSWIAVAMIVVTSTIFLAFSPSTTLEFIENITVKAKDANSENFVDLVAIKEPLIDSQIEVYAPNEPEPSIPESEFDFPTSELEEAISYSIPDGTVALTFDDGPSIYTQEIADILKDYQVGGTFFFIGENVLKYPDQVKYVNSNGYTIGSHSMNHTNLINLSYEKQELDLLHTNQLIEEIIQEKVVLFRPPYGSKNEDTLEVVNNNQAKMVLWNTDTLDWKSRNSDKIANAVQTSKASGSIILLHESQAVIDALPKIIDYLQGQDLQIVNLK